MDRPLFTVPVADLEYGDRELDQEIPLAWLTATFEGTEATPAGPGKLEVTLSKSGREVMVRGNARVKVTMPCARSLDPVDFDLAAEMFLLLVPGGPPVAPPKQRAPRAKKKDSADGTAAKKPGRAAREQDEEIPDDAAARDTYDGDKIVLDPFVREFLLLELPMVPLREDLRSEATPAIERPPEPAEGGRTVRETVDPRLAPLAAIASRLRAKKE